MTSVKKLKVSILPHDLKGYENFKENNSQCQMWVGWGEGSRQ